MATLQLNPVGMVSTDEGFISSISFRSAGGTVVYTPDANGQIGETGNAISALAATRFAGGQGCGGQNQGQVMKLVHG